MSLDNYTQHSSILKKDRNWISVLERKRNVVNEQENKANSEVGVKGYILVSQDPRPLSVDCIWPYTQLTEISGREHNYVTLKSKSEQL